MEKIQDFYNQIKDRFTNPLFLSFICSWIVINWRVTIALIWYDKSILKDTSYKTIFDFISNSVDTYHGIVIPISMAFLYTFTMPLIKGLITLFYSWVGKSVENKNMKIMGGGKIPIEKYFKIRAQYEERTEILERVIQKENAFSIESEALKTQLLKAETDTNSLQVDINQKTKFIDDLRNINMLDGYWRFYYSKENPIGESAAENLLIRDEEIYVENDRLETKKFRIRDFYFDNKDKTMFFVKYPLDKLGMPNDSKPIICRLVLNDNKSITGLENGITPVVYEKPNLKQQYEVKKSSMKTL